MFNKKSLQILIYCLCSVLLTLGFIGWRVQAITGDAAGTLKFLRAMNIIKNNFDGDVENSKLFDGAIKGMVSSLNDPYTAYLDKRSFGALKEMTDGSFGGIGIVFGKRGEDFVVISALEDNPGAQAGIKSGDIILAVDEVDAKSMNMEEMANKIRGKQGTEVTLKLLGKDGAERTIRIIRAEIKNPSVAGSMLPDTKIAYIRIAVFNVDTYSDFAKKYRELESVGMQATILDLRQNPGGVFEDGVQVAGMLIPKGTIVSLIDKNGNTYTEKATALDKVKYPLAVLVDHGSASAAEIVAGAIKDTGAGKLFGVKTFGKGSVQSVYGIGQDTAVKVTTAKYYTPSGVSIHNIGIEPDVVVELPEAAVTDTQLEAAKDYLLKELQQK